MLTKKVNTLIYAAAVMAAVLLMALFGFEANAMAAEGTDNNVEIYCTYTDAQGNEVCGDTLEAGTYNVGFYTKNVDKISVIEITATYNTDVVSIGGITNSIDSMTSMGTVNNNGDFVIGYVSDGDYVAVDSAAQHIATATVTFNQSCDAQDYITVSDNPNLTFIVADSANNNYGDEYALVDTFDGYTQGTLTKMTCDISPAVSGTGYDISGQIDTALDTAGTASGVGLVGITVDLLDADNNIVATDVTDENGKYTLLGVPAGEYTLSVHGDTTVDRQITLSVNESKTLVNIGIAMCDYDRNMLTNAYDLSVFFTAFNGEYNVYADFDGNSIVNAYDLSVFFNFFNQEVNYDNVVL